MLNHVLVIPLLLDVSGRDSWLSAIMAFLILIPFFLLVAFISKITKQQPIMSHIALRCGRWASRAIALVFCIYLFMTAAITIKDMTMWTTTSYLPQTPPSVIAGSFILLALIAASKGLRSVAYASALLLPIVVLFGEFVMVANIPHKDYGLLFPILENGTSKVWRGISYAGSGLTELLLLLFVQHRISTSIKKRYVVLIGFLLAGLTTGPLMGGISEFGPVESALQRYPAFEEWRLVKIGSFIEHVDFLSIFQWISGALFD